MPVEGTGRGGGQTRIAFRCTMKEEALNCSSHSRKWLCKQDTQHLPKVKIMKCSCWQRRLAVKFSTHFKKLIVRIGRLKKTLLVKTSKKKHVFRRELQDFTGSCCPLTQPQRKLPTQPVHEKCTCGYTSARKAVATDARSTTERCYGPYVPEHKDPLHSSHNNAVGAALIQDTRQAQSQCGPAKPIETKDTMEYNVSAGWGCLMLCTAERRQGTCTGKLTKV